ncbi:MAG: hypothetical protein C4327_02105, partial [Meiothermus sp.]
MCHRVSSASKAMNSSINSSIRVSVERVCQEAGSDDPAVSIHPFRGRVPHNGTMRSAVLGFFALLTFSLAQTCAGLPKLPVATPTGYCVGIVQRGLKMPRGILPMGNGDLLVVEMGGWTPGKGSLSRLRKQNGKYVLQRIFTGLDRPNGITLGPDQKVYVGEASRVFRFDPTTPQKEYVIRDLPATGRHPLKTMVFDRAGNLFLNIGSASDNCDGDKGKATCAEAATRGQIRRYTFAWPAGKVTGQSVYATGLRNSMALAVHSSGTLLQGENSRDAINLADPKISDETHPNDELNIVLGGKNYGWPYCYEDGKNAPEFPKYDCSETEKPTVLLPAHAAPLGMAYWSDGPGG